MLATISLDLFAVLFGGAIALIPAVADDRLHVGDIAYGWLRAAPGIGAAVMAVWMAARPIRRQRRPDPAGGRRHLRRRHHGVRNHDATTPLRSSPSS